MLLRSVFYNSAGPHLCHCTVGEGLAPHAPPSLRDSAHTVVAIYSSAESRRPHRGSCRGSAASEAEGESVLRGALLTWTPLFTSVRTGDFPLRGQQAGYSCAQTFPRGAARPVPTVVIAERSRLPHQCAHLLRNDNVGVARTYFAMTVGRVITCRCRLPHQSADWFAMTTWGWCALTSQ